MRRDPSYRNAGRSAILDGGIPDARWTHGCNGRAGQAAEAELLIEIPLRSERTPSAYCLSSDWRSVPKRQRPSWGKGGAANRRRSISKSAVLYAGCSQVWHNHELTRSIPPCWLAFRYFFNTSP